MLYILLSTGSSLQYNYYMPILNLLEDFTKKLMDKNLI